MINHSGFLSPDQNPHSNFARCWVLRLVWVNGCTMIVAGNTLVIYASAKPVPLNYDSTIKRRSQSWVGTQQLYYRLFSLPTSSRRKTFLHNFGLIYPCSNDYIGPVPAHSIPSDSEHKSWCSQHVLPFVSIPAEYRRDWNFPCRSLAISESVSWLNLNLCNLLLGLEEGQLLQSALTEREAQHMSAQAITEVQGGRTTITTKTTSTNTITTSCTTTLICYYIYLVL